VSKLGDRRFACIGNDEVDGASSGIKCARR